MIKIGMATLIALLLTSFVLFETFHPSGFFYSYVNPPEAAKKPHKPPHHAPPVTPPVTPPPIVYWYGGNFYEASFLIPQNDSFLQSRIWTRNNVNLLYAMNIQGNATLKWKKDLGSQYNYGQTQPIIADIDKDGLQEILVVVDGVVSQHDWVYCFNAQNGSVEWRSDDIPYLNLRRLSAFDIDQDGYLEIFGTVFQTGSTQGIWCINHNGTTRWHQSQSIMYSVVCYDLDTDKKLELLVNGANNIYCFNYTGGLEWSKPIPKSTMLLVGDMDGDGNPEIVTNQYQAGSGYVYYLTHMGDIIKNISIPLANVITPAMYDVNGDGKLEVLYCSRLSATSNNIGLLNMSGTTLWTFSTGGTVDDHQISIYDLNDDGKTEILFGSSSNKKFFCLNATGKQLWNYTTVGYCETGVLIANVDADNDLEVLFGERNGYLRCLNYSGGLEWSYKAGDMFRYNVAIDDVDDDGFGEMVLTLGDDADYFRLICLQGVE